MSRVVVGWIITLPNQPKCHGLSRRIEEEPEVAPMSSKSSLTKDLVRVRVANVGRSAIDLGFEFLLTASALMEPH